MKLTVLTLLFIASMVICMQQYKIQGDYLLYSQVSTLALLTLCIWYGMEEMR